MRPLCSICKDGSGGKGTSLMTQQPCNLFVTLALLLGGGSQRQEQKQEVHCLWEVEDGNQPLKVALRPAHVCHGVCMSVRVHR